MARPSRMPKDTEQKLITMIMRGFTSVEIAINLNRPISTIVFWRKKLYLPSTLSADDLEYRLKENT